MAVNNTWVANFYLIGCALHPETHTSLRFPKGVDPWGNERHAKLQTFLTFPTDFNTSWYRGIRRTGNRLKTFQAFVAEIGDRERRPSSCLYNASLIIAILIIPTLAIPKSIRLIMIERREKSSLLLDQVGFLSALHCKVVSENELSRIWLNLSWISR